MIHAYSKGWQDGSIYDPPLPGAIDGLRKLMETYAVFIHTTREALPVARWLHDTGGFDVTPDPGGFEFWNAKGVLLVANRKLPAIAYIDDRAVRFVSWDQVMGEFPPGPS